MQNRMKAGKMPGSSLELCDLHHSIIAGALTKASCGIVISDVSTEGAPLIYVNDTFCSMTGYSPEEAIGRNCRFLQGELTDSETVKSISLAMKSGEAGRFTLMNYRKDGTPFWNQLDISPIRGADGELTHFIGIQTDITGIKVAEEDMAAGFITNNPDPFIHNTSSGWITYANDAAKTMIGTAGCKRISDLLPPEHAELCGQCAKQRTSQKITRTVNDRVVLDYLYVPDNGDTHCSVFIRDVTDRAKSASIFRQFMENVPISIGMFDRKMRYLAVSRQWCKQYGQDELQILGHSHYETFYHIQEEIKERHRLALEGKKIASREIQVRWSDREEDTIWTRSSVYPWRDTGGQIGGLIIFAENIDAEIKEREMRRLAEERLSQAQKLEDLGTLAGGIAHEINTPAQYVGDNINFLQDSFKSINAFLEDCKLALEDISQDGDKGPPALNAIKNSFDNNDIDYIIGETPEALNQASEGISIISRIVAAVKEYAHPGSHEREPNSLNHIIETCVTLTRNTWKYHADVETDLSPDLPEVPLVNGEINQVLINMIVNASDAIAEAGLTPEEGKITLKTYRSGQDAVIEIGDNGIGIPSEIQKKIYDMFFTTKPSGVGSGQGLAISQKIIVQNHGGHISSKSKPGGGTLFTIRLPLDVCHPEGLN